MLQHFIEAERPVLSGKSPMEQYMLGRRICETLADGLAKTQDPGTDHIWNVSASIGEAMVNQASSGYT